MVVDVGGGEVITEVQMQIITARENLSVIQGTGTVV